MHSYRTAHCASRNRSRNCRSPFTGRLPVLASPLRSRLANASGRIEFIMFCLWTGLLLPVALHPASRRRSCLRLRTGQCSRPIGTFTLLLVRTFRRTPQAPSGQIPWPDPLQMPNSRHRLEACVFVPSLSDAFVPQRLCDLALSNL
jgi:hypothetical protein